MNDDLFHHEFSTNLAQMMEFHGTQWIQLRPEYKEEPIDCLDGSLQRMAYTMVLNHIQHKFYFVAL